MNAEQQIKYAFVRDARLNAGTTGTQMVTRPSRFAASIHLDKPVKYHAGGVRATVKQLEAMRRAGLVKKEKVTWRAGAQYLWRAAEDVNLWEKELVECGKLSMSR